jgi:6-phosphogluconolactonase
MTTEGTIPTRLFVYVGSYARSAGDEARPGGIVVFTADPENGSLEHQSEAGVGLEAGFLCVSPDLRTIYAVDEKKNDGRGPVRPAASISAFSRHVEDGSLAFLNSRPAFGPFPTYLSMDPTGARLVSASHGSFDHVERIVRTEDGFEIETVYDDSTVTLYGVDATGAIQAALDVQVLTGHGVDPHPSSPQAGGHPQASAHAHSATFDPSGRYVLVADKGVDKIYSYAFDPAGSGLDVVSVYDAPAGSAPRHIAFHRELPFVFVADELASTVTTFRFDSLSGALTALKRISATSPGYVGTNEPADIQVHPGGRFVFVNNRGEDSVVAFRINQETGELTFVDMARLATSIHPGLAARSFNFDPSGRFLFVGDRPAGKVLTFVVDGDTGRMTQAASTDVKEPAFVLVVAG